MARVPLVTPEAASDEQRAAFERVAASRGGVPNLFRAMGNNPELTRRVGDVGSYLRYEGSLPDRLREAVILAVAGRWGCDYERQAHEPIARRLGLSEAAVAGLRQGEVSDELDPLEAAAVRYGLALARDGRTGDDLLAPLRAQLEPAGLVELHILTGYYSMLALFLNGLAVDKEQA